MRPKTYPQIKKIYNKDKFVEVDPQILLWRETNKKLNRRIEITPMLERNKRSGNLDKPRPTSPPKWDMFEED